MWLILLPVILVLAVFAVLLYWSYPGEPVPYVDASGKRLPEAIAEKRFIEINGVEQGMFITGKDTADPVLLYLHGGLPEFFLARRYPTGLEDHFTIVWWEQRGSGLSFRADGPQEEITTDQLILDAIEVTNYLRGRFGKEKIYLVGHSGGTFLGIQVAARVPELFHAYVGIAQMSDQLASEVLAYDEMLDEYQQSGDHRMVRKLEAAPVTKEEGIHPNYLKIRDVAMHELGAGTTREMRSIFRGIMLPSLQCRAYTLAEKMQLWRGKARSGVSAIWDDVLSTDLRRSATELKIPVYFLHGVHDLTCSYDLSRNYFDGLKAPVKGFYSFENSAHSPHFEEPEKARAIMVEDVLQGTATLADSAFRGS